MQRERVPRLTPSPPTPGSLVCLSGDTRIWNECPLDDIFLRAFIFYKILKSKKINPINWSHQNIQVKIQSFNKSIDQSIHPI